MYSHTSTVYVNRAERVTVEPLMSEPVEVGVGAYAVTIDREGDILHVLAVIVPHSKNDDPYHRATLAVERAIRSDVADRFGGYISLHQNVGDGGLVNCSYSIAEG